MRFVLDKNRLVFFQVRAASWALDNGTTVVICNGHEDRAIHNIVSGKNIGTFFTKSKVQNAPVELMAMQGKFYNC